MAETKNEAFHRLAKARLEKITEAIRVFGNLSAPNYDWTKDEVLSYVGQIEAALEENVARFAENHKRWGTVPHKVLGKTKDGVEILEPYKAPDKRSKDPITRQIVNNLYGPDERDEVVVEERPSASQQANKATLDKNRSGKSMTLKETITAAADDREYLAGVVEQQKKVIEDLQNKLNELRGE